MGFCNANENEFHGFENLIILLRISLEILGNFFKEFVRTLVLSIMSGIDLCFVIKSRIKLASKF